jgi:flagellar biogenesis protein FliO
MNIYSQVMFLYGMTFLISMFVAFIIWVFSKIIDHSNGESSFFNKGNKQ